MKEPKLLRFILSNPKIQNSLSWPFKLNLIELKQINESLFLVGHDDSGGEFYLSGVGNIETLSFVFASSEGQAGKIANSFNEGIELIVKCPAWQSILKFSGNGKLEEMYKTAPFCQAEIVRDEPNLEKNQSMILSDLGINHISDPIQHLHQTVSSFEKINWNLKGEYGSLFGPFTSDINPSWK